MGASAPMKIDPFGRGRLLTPASLREQNELFRGSGGISQENRSQGFAPAFLDMETGAVYRSRFADGRQAPMHLLDGLPEEVIVSRQASGRVSAVKPTVVAGFTRGDDFYTREQAARAVAPVRDRAAALDGPPDQRLLLSAWERFLTDRELPHPLVRSIVVESWKRCQTSRVDPHSDQAPVNTDREQLEHLRQRNADVRAAARPILQQAGASLAHADALMLLTDAEGLILDAQGDAETCARARDINLTVGGLWNEAAAGTNAIGTALAMRQPVQLYGGEHYCEGIKHWTCAAEVICDPCDGRPMGALDISGLTASFDSRTPQLVNAMARWVETRLAENHLQSRARVLEASADAFRRRRGEGLLALDGYGHLIKVNALAHAALLRLGADLPLSPQTRIAALDLGLSEWERRSMLPAWLRPEWLHPIVHGKVRIGTLIMLPGAQARLP